MTAIPPMIYRIPNWIKLVIWENKRINKYTYIYIYIHNMEYEPRILSGARTSKITFPFVHLNRWKIGRLLLRTGTPGEILVPGGGCVDPIHLLICRSKAWFTIGYNGKTIGKPQENGGLMGFNGIYHLVMTNIAMENHNL